MNKAHSINKSYFHRTLGRNPGKSDNSFLKVEIGQYRDTDMGCISLTLRKSGSPALRLTLLGQEAQIFGLSLLTLGAQLSALNEEDLLRIFPDSQCLLPSISDGAFMFDCQEIKNAS